jgi:hypothetical protein
VGTYLHGTENDSPGDTSSRTLDNFVLILWWVLLGGWFRSGSWSSLRGQYRDLGIEFSYFLF